MAVSLENSSATVSLVIVALLDLVSSFVYSETLVSAGLESSPFSGSVGYEVAGSFVAT